MLQDTNKVGKHVKGLLRWLLHKWDFLKAVQIPIFTFVSHHAEVTSNRTSLSPFTKETRGAASWMRLWSLFASFIGDHILKLFFFFLEFKFLKLEKLYYVTKSWSIALNAVRYPQIKYLQNWFLNRFSCCKTSLPRGNNQPCEVQTDGDWLLVEN